jgi:hypothetical protein
MAVVGATDEARFGAATFADTLVGAAADSRFVAFGERVKAQLLPPAARGADSVFRSRSVVLQMRQLVAFSMLYLIGHESSFHLDIDIIYTCKNIIRSFV